MNLQHLWKCEACSGPCLYVLARLSKASIKCRLEVVHESLGEDDISNGHLISKKPFFAFKGGINRSNGFLQIIQTRVELGVSDFTPTKSTLVDSVCQRGERGIVERNPLINLRSLHSIRTHKLVASESAEVLADGSWLLEAALGGHEERELVSKCHFLVLG